MAAAVRRTAIWISEKQAGKNKEMHDEKMQMMRNLLNVLEKKNMWIEASIYISC